MERCTVHCYVVFGFQIAFTTRKNCTKSQQPFYSWAFVYSSEINWRINLNRGGRD